MKVAGQGGELGPDGVSGLNAVSKQALEASGIRITVAEPQGKAEGGAADRVSNGVTIEMPNPLASANPQFVGSRFLITIAPTAVGALASPPFDVESFSDVPIDGVADGGGFSSIAGTFGDVFAAPAEASISGGGGSGSGSGDAGSPVAFEETSNVLAHDGGVTGGLVLASGAFMLFAGRWVKRYVAQFVATQDGGA
jgi:hypothetical protein